MSFLSKLPPPKKPSASKSVVTSQSSGAAYVEAEFEDPGPTKRTKVQDSTAAEHSSSSLISFLPAPKNVVQKGYGSRIDTSDFPTSFSSRRDETSSVLVSPPVIHDSDSYYSNDQYRVASEPPAQETSTYGAHGPPAAGSADYTSYGPSYPAAGAHSSGYPTADEYGYPIAIDYLQSTSYQQTHPEVAPNSFQRSDRSISSLTASSSAVLSAFPPGKRKDREAEQAMAALSGQGIGISKGAGSKEGVKEVKQSELVGQGRVREDQLRSTGIAFGPAHKPVSSTKGKPNKLAKRKHQIGSLYFELQQKEMELAERRSRGMQSKAQTQGKYGWS